MLSEAVANILRHANASRVVVFAEMVEGCLNIEIDDNGFGYVPGKNTAGRGLAGIRHRATVLGAQCGLAQLESGGSRFWLKLPMKIQAMSFDSGTDGQSIE